MARETFQINGLRSEIVIWTIQWNILLNFIYTCVCAVWNISVQSNWICLHILLWNPIEDPIRCMSLLYCHVIHITIHFIESNVWMTDKRFNEHSSTPRATMDLLTSYLENSSIHGLGLISHTKSFRRALWVCIVISGFTAAGIIINKSFENWANNPITTTVEKTTTSAVTAC